jgi:glycerol kinase
MQFQADLLGIPVIRPATTETTALGAAYLAGLAAGFWKDQDEIQSLWQVGKRFEPGHGAADANRFRNEWHRALERSKAWNQT